MDLGNDPKRIAAAMERIESFAKQYRKPLLGFASESGIVDKYKAGYRLLGTVFDTFILKNGIDDGYRKGKDIIENHQKERRQVLSN